MSKPTFNPNKPFESVKPAFNPNAPFTSGSQQGLATQQEPVGSFPEARAILESDDSPIVKAWNALQVPSQMSKRGLSSMASMVPEPEPTGDLPADLAKGFPRIAANTIAEAVPGFIDRTSMLLGGGAKVLQRLRPVGSVIGQGIATEAESATNAVPGSLKAAWNDPTLIFSKGRKAASSAYEAGKAELEQGANIFKDMYKPDEIISTAKNYLSKGGQLEPAEALIYRKALDVVGRSKNVVKDSLFGMRKVADVAAKESPNISEADALFKRGQMAESLRRLIPQNKYGGSSAFKMALMAALGPSGAGLLSPVVHGAVATAGGALARVATNPSAAITARRALITSFIDNRSKGEVSR